MPFTTNLRFFLWALLAIALATNYAMWSREFPPAPPTPTTVGSAHPAPGNLGNSVPTAPTAGSPGTTPAAPAAGGAPAAGVPAAPAAPAAANGAAAGGAATVAGAVSAANTAALSVTATAPSVNVVTDVLDLQVSLAGGDLTRARLLAYPQQKGVANAPVQLLNSDAATSLFEIQGGLAGTSGETAPTHLARYTSPVRSLRLLPGQNELTLPLTWTDGRGLTVTKTLTLHRGSYVIDISYRIDNAGSKPWSFAEYAQILRYNAPLHRSYFNPSSYAYKGPAIYDGAKFEKLNFEKGGPFDQTVRDGYLAALQPYFVASIVPPMAQTYRYTLQGQGDEFLLKALGPTQTVAAGAMLSVQNRLFVGPKLQSELDQIHPRMDLVADYGRLTFLAKPLFWLLAHVQAGIGNWGFAIIIVTFLLKLLLYPLSETSYRSMAKMKALSPRLTNLRETYKDDKEKLNRAMMDLYKKEKVNPLAGCLPMVIQIPVFFAWYYVLRDSVELRQAPFLFWINDLSARDPWYVLPAIMAAAMFVQTKLNPQVGDPTQQKLMLFMPVAMSATFAFFPAGLVLYYVTNTILGILQQWNINRRFGVASARAKR
jgi:YidC/Oxa1 family membrane protein insertase